MGVFGMDEDAHFKFCLTYDSKRFGCGGVYGKKEQFHVYQ